MSYADGSKFDGVFDGGHPSKGTFKYSNGNKYIGDLKSGKPNGQGRWE